MVFGLKRKLATGLDILSSTLLEPTTFIRNPVLAGEKVKQRRADVRAGKKGAVSSIIGETLTATALIGGSVLGAGTLAGRSIVAKTVPKLLPTTIPKALGTATLGGILITSKEARKKTAKIIDDPTKVGREAGKVIDKVVAGEETGRVGDIIKTAGLVGGGAVLGAGVVAGGKKVIDIIKRPKVLEPSKSPTETPSSAALPSSSIPSQKISSPNEPPVVEPTKEVSAPTPSVVVNNNIKINAANKRFINNVKV